MTTTPTAAPAQFYSATSFLDAWQRGMIIAGPQFFGDGRAPGLYSSLYDMAPDYDMVQRAMGYLSSGEALFLAAMYSFYNPTTGKKLLAKLDGAPGGLAAGMDESRRRVIADLLISYAGW
ncbi:hypothetical protein ORI20_13985 [Mycobacterium sp. CVI_P3]|uniref:Uncharacterized protein n=1 Tax=Mycobacterium pinniadriaticum TaxID=2994102 RepID=A0ABT3SE78_9MYCO|nr:hypothetical protein [Mycobacterium pinniadriaticum]MCX2931390.1 hypothetical protein [Mycobacterium pinniadriaticum]MCX2937814.1 hypothetical protein [Mycobacterium pinniadriaticum]